MIAPVPKAAPPLTPAPIAPTQRAALHNFVRDFELCERLFFTDDGRPWRLDEMPFFTTIYEDPAHHVVLKTSRQSTKTTYLRNKLVLRSLQRRGNAALYVAPTQNQVRDFSKKKLDPVFAYNPALKARYAPAWCDWNVGFKQLAVRGALSTITLRSTGGHQGAEGIRGGTYNDVFIDEYQSFEDAHVPVILECQATFDGRDGRPEAYHAFTGTPLSRNNPLEREWNRSKGFEWCIRCRHCTAWNDPLGLAHLDPARPYLFCQHCGKDVGRLSTGEAAPPEGEWVATNAQGRFPGYRVVRLMMPWARWRTDNHDGVLDRLETWPERRFMNEVMGLPFDGGMQPVTEADVRACSDDYALPETEADEIRVAAEHAQYPTFAGLDWAMTTDETTPSYTTFAVFALVNGRLKLLHAHRFTGLGSDDPDHVLARIGRWMDRFHVQVLGCDYGVGYKENQRLMAAYPGRVATMHYHGGGQTGSVRTTYDPVGRKHMVPRTPSLDELFRQVKARAFAFPRYESARPFLEDLLRMMIEVSEASRTIVYRRSGTDDFVHVANYALLARRLAEQGAFATDAPIGAPIGFAGTGIVGVGSDG